MEPSSAVKDAHVDAISSVQCSKFDVPRDGRFLSRDRQEPRALLEPDATSVHSGGRCECGHYDHQPSHRSPSLQRKFGRCDALIAVSRRYLEPSPCQVCMWFLTGSG